MSRRSAAWHTFPQHGRSTHNGTARCLEDEKGGRATVTIANVGQSNGVIHVIDHVLLPQ